MQLGLQTLTLFETKIMSFTSTLFQTRGPFLESPGNLSGPISVFGDKSFLTEVNIS